MAVKIKIAMIKYKLYTVTNNGIYLKEYFSKSEIEKFRTEDEQTLFECAENMIYKFNRGCLTECEKRYVYKLEKVTVRVIGSQEYYGLNIGSADCEPEFPY